MASMRLRRKSYQARVARKGHPAIVKTFSALADAERWANAKEAKLAFGIDPVEASDTPRRKLAELVRQVMTSPGRYVLPEQNREECVARTTEMRLRQLEVMNQNKFAGLVPIDNRSKEHRSVERERDSPEGEQPVGRRGGGGPPPPARDLADQFGATT